MTMFTDQAGRLRSGDRLPSGAVLRDDLSEALADGWQAAAADSWCRTPFVCAVAHGTAIGDVLIDAAAARRALELDAAHGAG